MSSVGINAKTTKADFSCHEIYFIFAPEKTTQIPTLSATTWRSHDTDCTKTPPE